MRTLILTLLLSTSTIAAAPIDYVRDVLPIFETYCIGCHTADEAQGGLVMESHAALMAGGENGLAITAGAASSSRLFMMAAGKMEPVMPPDDAEGPSDEELATIAAWIDQGAIGPDGDVPIKRDLKVPRIETSTDVMMPVTAIATSPDGNVRAIARHGNLEIRTSHSEVVATIKDGIGKVNAVEFSRDGKRLLIASGLGGAYGQAIVFDVASGDQVIELLGHRDMLYAATFSPDESIIATAGYDRQIILWDAKTGQQLRTLDGHNGAIFDLAFSPDGKTLVSACADETAKVWNVATGQRLDTLGQPEGEVFAVGVTGDGKFILAASADNRLRVWRLRSAEKPAINPIVATRFVDETPLVNFAISPDGNFIVVLSEAGNLKVIRTSDWNQAAVLTPLSDSGTDLAISPDAKVLTVSLMNGDVVTRNLPSIADDRETREPSIAGVYMDLDTPAKITETETDSVIEVPRGVIVDGAIGFAGDVDAYRWKANRGEVWAIDADLRKETADGAESLIDPVVAVYDESGDPVLRVRLQAIRDSYFTFRGKDSRQVNDFRVFNWQEMGLNDYFYANGEVTRLFMYPRGPDSGFDVYPGEGNRWTYFGTSHITHALGEPAYVVRPLAAGEEPTANGLPVFDVYYENDDDPMRTSERISRLLFVAPEDARYTIRVADTRGEGGADYRYRLTLRAAEPSFTAKVNPIKPAIPRGGGREFAVSVDRLDGFEGEVRFDVDGLPVEAMSNFPLTVEAGQKGAVGLIYLPADAKGWDGNVAPTVTASAMVRGRYVERSVGSLGDLKVMQERPGALVSLRPSDRVIAAGEPWTLTVRRGETVSARVLVDRTSAFTNEVSFGKEDAGRNGPHGVYVDNIGLNGLLALEGQTEREFFITADPVAKLGKRAFFLKANVAGGITTQPIVLEVTQEDSRPTLDRADLADGPTGPP